MDASSIARTLGGVFVVLGLAAAAVGGGATVFGIAGAHGGFYAAAGGALFLGAALRIATAGRAPGGGVREGLLFAFLAWATAPLIAAVPFYAGGFSEFGAAYFDALSALTTTGFRPLSFAPAEAPVLILWWNLMQWAGGGATIVIALVVLAALDLTGPGVHRSALFTLQSERLFGRFGPVAREVFTLYAAVTAVIFGLALLGGAGAGDAFVIATASLATGGVLLFDGQSTLTGVPLLALFAGAAGLAFGATNFALHWDAARGRLGAAYAKDPETQSLILFMLAGAVWAAVAHGGRFAAGWERAAVEGLSVAATGVWDTGVLGAAAVALPIAVAFALIGGSPVSTAGGVKFLRFFLLIRQALVELRRLAHPSSVAQVRYRDRVLPRRALIGLLVYVIGYAGVIAVLMVALGAVGGSFRAAAAGAVAAVANAGPLITLLGDETATRLRSEPGALVALSVGMVLGRVEVLAAFAMATPAFWRR